MESRKYCLVAANTHFNNSQLIYNYSGLGELSRGQMVTVPLGKKEIRACILKEELCSLEGIEEKKIKSVLGVLERPFYLDEKELSFFQWASEYYHYPLGPLIFDSIPKLMKRPRPFIPSCGEGRPLEFELNEEQQNCVKKIFPHLEKGFGKWLIHGVTGSGKTAVYLNLMKKALAKGRSILFLLPEINLTPQFLRSFIRHLEVPVYSYSSVLTGSQKYNLWKELKESISPKVIVGVRSSIFLPLNNIGLIVVDEEHDSSFKQEERCPYNARDLAIKRAQYSNVPIILGSATPSLETFYQFNLDGKRKKHYLCLEKRVGNSYFPKINFINITKSESKNFWPLNKSSIEKIKSALDKGEQVLVFINRLGYADFLQCNCCGKQFKCPNCSVNLKYFKNKRILNCRYCEISISQPEICKDCGNSHLIQKGFGTEKCESILKNIFPKRKIARFDREELKTFKEVEKRLDDFHKGDIDILVGTQMLSKGHNFEKVNLVLVLGIDSMLNSSDFRANERVFQQIKQISGRSGRFSKKSEVCILTLNQKSHIFEYLKKNNLKSFYEDELILRKNLSCAPFSKMVNLSFSSNLRERTLDNVYKAHKILNDLKKKYFSSVNIMAPRSHNIEKIVNKYTWIITLKGSNINDLHNILNSFILNSKKFNLKIKIDVDPYQIN
ncbi:primosomal protein N' [Bacteriovoracales bacterium]|nr:primosomal protein N' [Bacteriovoracales bacterium]